jgi:hypothetical protein
MAFKGIPTPIEGPVKSPIDDLPLEIAAVAAGTEISITYDIDSAKA